MKSPSQTDRGSSISAAIRKRNKRNKRIKYLRERRARHEELGVCRECAVRPKVEGRKRCQRCLERDRKVKRSKYARLAGPRRALGLCVRCGREAMPGRSSCGKCAETYINCNARQSNRRRENGLCMQCGKDPLPGKRRCGPCLEYQRKRMKARRRRLKGILPSVD